MIVCSLVHFSPKKQEQKIRFSAQTRDPFGAILNAYFLQKLMTFVKVGFPSSPSRSFSAIFSFGFQLFRFETLSFPGILSTFNTGFS